MEKLFEKKGYAIFFSMLAMVLWATAIPMIKTLYVVLDIAGDDVGSKIYIAGIRFFIAGLLTYLYYMFFREEKVELRSINLSFVIKLALVQTTIQYIFYYIGLSNTLGVRASIIQASNAFITIIMARLFLPDEDITKEKAAALILGTLGILYVNLGQGADFAFKLTGEGFIFFATSFGAFAAILLRKYLKDQNPFLITSLQLTLGSLPLIAIGYFTSPGLNLSGMGLVLLLYGSFVSATAFSLWSLVLKYQSAGEFGIYKLFIPIFGSILSVVLLGEPYSMRLFIGLVLVLLGSVILNMNFEEIKKKFTS